MSNIVKVMGWTGYVARMEEGFKMLTGKSTGQRLLGRPRRRWKDNIRINPKQNRYQYEELISLRIGIIKEPL